MRPRDLIPLALALTALAGCGASTKTVTKTASNAGRYSAHQASVKQQVESRITTLAIQDQGQASGQAGTLAPTVDGTSCVAINDTTMNCTVQLADGEQQAWSANIDQDTGTVHAQRES